jgi:DNA polymerase delta subunit 4
MPTTRRTSSRTSGGATGKQSTLSFNHKVTKSVAKSAKDVISSAPVKKSPLSKTAKVDVSDEEAAIAKVEPVAEQAKVESVEATKPEPPSKNESEVRAEKVSNAAIEKYWRTQEAARIAKRVHQGDLSTGEKVLRYFDVSSQYGVRITSLWTRFPTAETNEMLALALHRYHTDEEVV